MENRKVRIIEDPTGNQLAHGPNGEEIWCRIVDADTVPGEAERQERIDWLHRRLLRLRAERDQEAAEEWVQLLGDDQA